MNIDGAQAGYPLTALTPTMADPRIREFGKSRKKKKTAAASGAAAVLRHLGGILPRFLMPGSISPLRMHQEPWANASQMS